MGKTLEQSAIDAITRAGFDVYMRERSQSFAYFTDGIRIGYIQRGSFGGFDIGTTHKPNRTTGTGFSLYRGLDADGITRKRLEECFTYAPAWARGHVRGADLNNDTHKWRDLEEFLGRDSWNAGFVLVAKGEG